MRLLYFLQKASIKMLSMDNDYHFLDYIDVLEHATDDIVASTLNKPFIDKSKYLVTAYDANDKHKKILYRQFGDTWMDEYKNKG